MRHNFRALGNAGGIPVGSKITVPVPEVGNGMSRLLTDNCRARSAPPHRADRSLCQQVGTADLQARGEGGGQVVGGGASSGAGDTRIRRWAGL